MSLERRKPFALLQAKPTDSVPATNSTPPQPYLSRPRRQMPVAYHHQPQQLYNPPRRYATVLQKSSHSSATSSADSFYSAVSSIPPRRSNLSPVEAMAARVRARWAALEALERTSGAPGPIVTLVDAITATNTDTAENNESINNNDDTVTITTRSTLYNVSRIRIQSHTTTEWRQRQWEEIGKESEKVSEDEISISMSMSMQVDEYENILPLRPAPLALAQDIKPCQGPASSGALVPAAPSMVKAMAPIMHDPSEENRNGFTSYRICERAGGFLPTGGSLGTVPTSTWSFKMTESQRHVRPHRPTQALMAPSIRKRPSLTDELEEAVCFSLISHLHAR